MSNFKEAILGKIFYIQVIDYNKLNELAIKYGVSKSAIAVSWILRHPAKILPIVGTTSIKHLSEIIEANNITLSREEWYALYLSNNHFLP